MCQGFVPEPPNPEKASPAPAYRFDIISTSTFPEDTHADPSASFRNDLRAHPRPRDGDPRPRAVRRGLRLGQGRLALDAGAARPGDLRRRGLLHRKPEPGARPPLVR